MTKHLTAGLWALLLFPFALGAQGKKLTIEDAVLKQYSEMSPATLSRLGWVKGADQLSYLDSDGEEPVLKVRAATADTWEPQLSLSQFNAAFTALGETELGGFPRMTWDSPSSFHFMHGNAVYSYDLNAKKAEKINSHGDGASHLDMNAQFGFAYTIEQNLWISLPGQEPKAITQEENEFIRNGEAAHRYEFGINQGTFWSPDGRYLAYYRTDETMVLEHPILDLSKEPGSWRVIRYPFAGQKSHQTKLMVYDTQSGHTTELLTGGDPEHYLTNIAWGPDSKTIYIAEINRDQDHMEMKSYDAASGAYLSTLFEEKDPKWIEPKTPMMFIPGRPDEFIWLSQRDGNKHVYHYNTSGKVLGQLTKGDWIVTQIVGFDDKGKTLFLETTLDNATERHLIGVDLKKGGYTLLTPGKGNHAASVSTSGKYVLDNWSSTEVPRVLRVLDARKGQPLQTIFTAPNPTPDYTLGDVSLFTIKAADGKTDLWCRMITPPNMDRNKKHPVIVYVYNGPGVQIIRNVWRAAAPMWMYYAAQEGYVVFTVDGRGSANRSRDFEQAIFRNLGDVEIADQLEGVKYLKAQPFVDPDRMVVHGWSYGGFMTSNLMLRAPGTFQAGVAGGPVIDWSLYEVMYTERYMDTPEQNPDGYAKSRVTEYADQLEGKLLLIHGTSDDVVVWQHSLEMVERCVDDGVQIDYFVYPNHPHNVRGKDRVHLMTKVLNYLFEAVE